LGKYIKVKGKTKIPKDNNKIVEEYERRMAEV
jgi:hypothetical protein